MLKITTAKSKTGKIGPYDDPRIFFWVSYDVSHEKLGRHDLMRGWCRYPRSNSTHEDQISEINTLVRLNLNDFWIG